MHVIASNRPWHRDLARELSERTGLTFELIDRKEDLVATRLAELGAETIFLPHWSYIIPASVYDAFECIVFHMTDLPYGRGGSPLQNLIVRGHESTMISALRCGAGIDTGPIYLKRPLALAGSAQEIFLRASRIIGDMIVEIVTNRPQPAPQQGEPVTFKRRAPADGDWSMASTLEAVYDHIRMLDADGYPPAFVTVGGFRLEFGRAALRDGAVVADVRITKLQQDQDR